MANFTALYDACVLYPAPLRDLLMHLALTDLYRAKWTDRLHDEWIENVLVKRPDLKRHQLERTRELMNRNVRDCLVENYEDLIPTLQLPDPNDRHILAAAIRSSTDVIVTHNLKDIPQSILNQYGIEAQHPDVLDVFIIHLIDLSSGKVCVPVKNHHQSLKHPPKTIEEYFTTLEKQALPQTVSALREFQDLI